MSPLLNKALLAALALTAAPTAAFAAKPDAASVPKAEQQIRAQRAAFNKAIADGSLNGIAAVLADDVQLITGSDSIVYAGKAAQLLLWSRDLSDPHRGIYVRTPDEVRLSPILPIALETGHWRGANKESAKDWAAGDYAAKWRLIGGKWRIESETYMTTSCGGSYCPKNKERRLDGRP